MTGVYDNKHFPLQTKIVLKFCSTCKKLKPLKQFNKCPWNTYFFRTYYKSCSHDKDEKRKKKITQIIHHCIVLLPLYLCKWQSRSKQSTKLK